MKVESVPLESLKPYDNNAKRHTPEQIEAVGNSIREFGFRNPIIAWHNEDGVAEIVAGHARAAAAKYYNLPGITVQAMEDAGARYYNEAILVTPAGSLPIRAGKQFMASRKLGKTHQNVLTFVKGDPKRATERLGDVVIPDMTGDE